MILDPVGHIASIEVALLKAYGADKVSHVRAPEDTLRLMRERSPDLLIVNWTSMSEDWTHILRLVRDEIQSPDPFIHVMMVTPAPSHRRIKLAIAMGVDTVVTIPLRADTFFNHLRRIVEADRTFVRSSAYFGPDRRRRTSAVVLVERRGTGRAELVDPDEVVNWRVAQREIAKDQANLEA